MFQISVPSGDALGLDGSRSPLSRGLLLRGGAHDPGPYIYAGCSCTMPVTMSGSPPSTQIALVSNPHWKQDLEVTFFNRGASSRSSVDALLSKKQLRDKRESEWKEVRTRIRALKKKSLAVLLRCPPYATCLV